MDHVVDDIFKIQINKKNKDNKNGITKADTDKYCIKNMGLNNRRN